jgi:hypothetical protein
MPITYTNRKGFTYFLNKGVTKTGKPRYYLAREQMGETIDRLRIILGQVGLKIDRVEDRLKAELDRYVQFTPVMRFILDDPKTRKYHAERWCYRGSIDDWIYASHSGKIDQLAIKLTPKLGTEEFYELY